MTPLESHLFVLAALALSTIPTLAIVLYDRLRPVTWEEADGDGD